MQKIQLIDEQKVFHPELDSKLLEWGLMDCGTDYNAVAILGAQSTGKSTTI